MLLLPIDRVLIERLPILRSPREEEEVVVTGTLSGTRRLILMDFRRCCLATIAKESSESRSEPLLG